MARQIAAFLAVFGILSCTSAGAGADDSWVGKQVMLKKPGLKIGYTDASGRDVDVATVDDMIATVLAEKTGYISLRQNGVDGWLDKDDAVLLTDAVGYFTKRIAGDPDDAYAFACRGCARRQRADLDKALADYSAAIRLQPKSAAWRLNRGAIYADRKDHDKAIADYTEAIALNPKYAYAYNNRGNSFAEKKDYGRAIADFDAAIRLDPAYVTAYKNRAKSYADQKDYDRAIADYTKALSIDPKNVEGYNDRGNVHALQKDFPKAIADYKKAVKLEPTFYSALIDLSWLMATCPADGVRDGAQAVKYAKKACELSEWKDAYAIGTLAAASAEAGNFSDAVKWAKRALEIGIPNRDDETQARHNLKLFEARKPYRETR